MIFLCKIEWAVFLFVKNFAISLLQFNVIIRQFQIKQLSSGVHNMLFIC